MLGEELTGQARVAINQVELIVLRAGRSRGHEKNHDRSVGAELAQFRLAVNDCGCPRSVPRGACTQQRFILAHDEMWFTDLISKWRQVRAVSKQCLKLRMQCNGKLWHELCDLSVTCRCV